MHQVRFLNFTEERSPTCKGDPVDLVEDCGGLEIALPFLEGRSIHIPIGEGLGVGAIGQGAF